MSKSRMILVAALLLLVGGALACTGGHRSLPWRSSLHQVVHR